MSNSRCINEIMSRPFSIAKSAPVTEALDKMLDEGVDPLIVVHNNGVIGTISRESIAILLGSKRNSQIAPTNIHVANCVEEDFTTVYPDEDMDILVPLLQRYKLVVVYDKEHNLIGQVTSKDLVLGIEPEGNIADYIERVLTIDPEERVIHARRRILDEKIHRFVVAQEGTMVGIITETDIATAMRNFRKDVEDKHQDHRIRNLIVRDIMTSPVISVDVKSELKVAITIMKEKNLSALPVTENGALLGIISWASLVAHM